MVGHGRFNGPMAPFVAKPEPFDVHNFRYNGEMNEINLESIRQTRQRLGSRVRHTPTWEWQSETIQASLGATARVFLKLELLQHAGSFKARGALAVMMDLDAAARSRGVTAVSAGNHAMAVAYASRVLETTAKVVMPENANPARVNACRDMGAEVTLVPDVQTAFQEVKRIESEEGRTFVHPFDGPLTAHGTATVGMELCESVTDLDAVIVPIGGGGLCAGVASAVKLMAPNCRVYGVEPTGADTMHRSFESGQVESIDQVRTIADSLGAPHSAPYSLALCRKYVDELCLIEDWEMCRAMALLFSEVKLAVEPAGAASTAALLGPLRKKLAGKRVGLIVCGTNIDLEGFCRWTQQGFESLRHESAPSNS